MRRRASGLLIPELEPQMLEVTSSKLTDFGRSFLLREFGRNVMAENPTRPRIAGGASFSDAYETKVLEHIAGKTTLTLVTPIFMALTTVVPTDSSTGTSITEATYTGYARKSIAASDWSSAVSGAPGSIATANQLAFAACTGGTSTIIGFALTDASTVGNIIMWGTISSTVISTTQTPPTVAAAALSMTVD